MAKASGSKQRQRVVDDEDEIEQGSSQKSENVPRKKRPRHQPSAERSEGDENQAPQLVDEDGEEDDEDEQRRQEEMASPFRHVNDASLIDASFTLRQNELIENFTDQSLPSCEYPLLVARNNSVSIPHSG